jgi:predicted nucleic acid-binding protein
MFDEGVFDGNIKKEDPLFIKLKQIFDKEDAELIFQAEKNDLDYFSTLDKKTILNRLREKENQLKEINLKIKIVSPSQLIKELGLDTKSL